MRLVIDLVGSHPGVLALAQEIVRTRGANEVWLAGRRDNIAALRHAFAGLLPDARVLLCHLPAAASPWRAAAAELVRENFLACLGAELVFAPDAPAATGTRFATVSGLDVRQDLWQQLGAAVRALPAPPSPPPRPRLAVISPLPPQHSGIADYSAALIPELARHYDIELVVDQPHVSETRLAPYPLRQLAWFEAHAHEYDRLLYHFGNSEAHRHMFALLRRHPGVVVLHDFFLSGVLDNLERDGYLPNGFVTALHASHGYTGLLEHGAIGRNAAIWKYPLNKEVLEHASGVVVHAAYPCRLAEQWYGPGSAADWQIVPMARVRVGAGTRAQARARLGLRRDAFLVCSFGMLGPTKLNEELLDAFLDSEAGADPHARLVFVGENEAGLYGAALTRKIVANRSVDRIGITGYVSAACYADYLAACDVAVQLRSNTRGETSAAVLDCLLHGVPTIVNAHGTNADLPDAVVLKVAGQAAAELGSRPHSQSGPQPGSQAGVQPGSPAGVQTIPQIVAQLSAALARLHAEPALREGLSQRALAHMQAHHQGAHAAAKMGAAIEHFALHSARSHYQALIGELGTLPMQRSDEDLRAVACAIALNQPARAPRQLLVDVSALVQADLRTGIQRVVRSVLLALIAEPPPGVRIEPVYSHGGNRGYQYARRFGCALVGMPELQLEDAPVELRAGDIFLGLDLFTNGTAQNHALLESMRAAGVALYFTIYDLLPVLRPEVFPYGAERYFSEFLSTVAAVSDGLVCISRAVSDEMCAWLAQHAGKERNARLAPLKIGYFHLGADIDASAPSTGMPPNAQQVLASLAARPSFLMVGTVEPRKGQAQALAAFELLWARGHEVNLVIVGKQGWMVEQLAARVKAHPERDLRLFWLPGVSDQMLLKLYAGAAALLAASEGEGFGLPLIEAAQHTLPIVARDLPVFREVAGEHAYYFKGKDADALAAALTDWLALAREGRAPSPAGIGWLTWRASARQLLDAVVGQQWYREIH
ncbi:MAG: glycosyltransferase [Pseudomonadota bacterium]